MKRTITILAAAATLMSATAAQTAEHTILILPDAYFPAITYIDEGDTVHFENVSGATHTIIAKNNNWELGPISNNATATKVIGSGVQKTFYNKDLTDENGAYVIQGNMSYSDAPLD